ncbi:Gfo/Idh/MocA family protein [Synoicihabitans lomoniglobus]|uniref:Gfo/Idh/MocA family oxidoreductase n=1 Tax=Synoicihabitans lomoniglobus TaxID=2909285 RepID=A0AAF0CM48_9BACT|nr:Gfo/Idh/MocA family oxidoreductase [Opitutaceae bacterium LMO-M01]WED63618.1 Gfo/Idh/MocA family oxidoreductase [Opitutaceae bacterium LMO-M01]
MNRRKFVSNLAVAGAAVAASSRLRAVDTKKRPTIGLIGSGWYGGVNLEVFARCTDVEVVALCDVNTRNLTKTLALVAKHQTRAPQTYTDHRAMLAAGAPDIVIIASPDHWHALQTIDAIQAGCDVYLEKPIGVDVIEGEAMVAAARKYDRVVQVNTQRRSNPLYLEARDHYMRNGRMGKISLVETYSYLGIEGWSDGPIPDAEVPAHLDYERYAGPAPKVPYKAIIEDRGWRSFMAYGNGIIGNLGVHMLDKVRMLLDLGWPETIHSTGGIYVHKNSFSDVSDTQHSTFHYPDLDISWEHRMWGASPIPQRNWSDQWGARFLGEHGTLNLTMYEYVFTPADGGPREGRHMMSTSGDLENVDFGQAGEVFQETENRHVLDFMAAREQRSRPLADIEEGHISSAMCELANLSIDLGRPLAYDPASRTVPGDAEATGHLARAYRAPWVHPDPTTV